MNNNTFVDADGILWIGSVMMAKKLKCSDGLLSWHKNYGQLVKGKHYVQQKDGCKRIFYNPDEMIAWYNSKDREPCTPKGYPRKQPQQSELEKVVSTTTKNKLSVHIYIEDELMVKLKKIQEFMPVVTEERLGDYVVSRQSVAPSMTALCNMLMLKAADDIDDLKFIAAHNKLKE